jgi:hypothetical protein
MRKAKIAADTVGKKVKYTHNTSKKNPSWYFLLKKKICVAPHEFGDLRN